MYFLLDACQHPAVLRIIYFAILLLNIVFVIVPIGLIIFLMLDFGKAVVSSSCDKQVKSTKLVVKRIIYALVIFVVPWIIGTFMELVSQVTSNVDYITCINIAKTGDFTYYDNLLKEEEEAIRDDMINSWEEDINDSSSDTSSGISSSNSSDANGSLATGRSYSEAALAMMKKARGEAGNGGSKYGSNGQPWCGYFVIWNLKNTYIDNVGSVYDVISKEGRIVSEGLAGGTIRNFKNHSNLSFYYSKYYGGNYVPKAGDIIYFWYPNRNNNKYWNRDLITAERHTDHVGLIEYVDSDGNIHTVEGNCSNQVKAFVYSQNNDTIMGYGSWYDK